MQSTRLGHESSAARPSTSASAPDIAGEAADGIGTAVWTDKQDYSPEQTVTIYGAGFTPGATVTVTVVRPDGSKSPPPWTVTADSSGGFTTTYQLDGITGRYTVTASDGTNTATTTFTDAISTQTFYITTAASNYGSTACSTTSGQWGTLGTGTGVSQTIGTSTSSNRWYCYATSGTYTPSSVDNGQWTFHLAWTTTTAITGTFTFYLALNTGTRTTLGATYQYSDAVTLGGTSPQDVIITVSGVPTSGSYYVQLAIVVPSQSTSGSISLTSAAYLTSPLQISCNPNPTTVGTPYVTCTATSTSPATDLPAHITWTDASSNLQWSDACPTSTTNPVQCTSGPHAPASAGTWTIRVISDSDSTVLASTTLTVNTGVNFDVTVSQVGDITSGNVQSYKVTITNTGTVSIGSVRIVFGTPSSWGTPSSITFTAPSGQTWTTGTLSAGTLNAAATSGSGLAVGDSLTISFSITAPSASGWSPATVTAYNALTWSGSSLAEEKACLWGIVASPKVSVQLAFVLDGSGSIGETYFLQALRGLAAAISDSSVVPQDGSVELTIIEFAGSGARVEVLPVVITSQTVATTVANTICNTSPGSSTNCDLGHIEYIGSYTPTASGTYLAADILKASPNYAAWKYQAVNIVTDGGPNSCPNSNTDHYGASQCDSDTNGGPNGRAASQTALAYLLSTLAMTSDKDQVDVEFVGSSASYICTSCTPATTNSEWLRARIVWPTQLNEGGYFAPPFNRGPGWERLIATWGDFSATVGQKFRMVLKLGLTVSKIVNGGQEHAYDFTLYVKDSTGNDVAGSPFQGSAGGTTFSDLPPGTYTLSEDQISGYTLAISGDGCTQTGDYSGTVTLTGSNRQCTFTNNYLGPWLDIVKNSGIDDGTFGFTVTGPSPSTHSIETHGTGSGGTGISDTGFFAIDPSTPGNLYTVAETNTPGWALVSSSCTTGAGSPLSPQGFAVSQTDSVTCTFTDTKRGHIIVDKVTNPSPDPTNTAFTFTPSWSSQFTLTNAATPVDSGPLLAGTYSVAESSQANWLLTSATCTDGSPVTAIVLDPGETVTCTFTNTKNNASPTIATQVHNPSHSAVTSVTLGTAVHDSATVSGGSSPTGTVTYHFYTNDGCTGTPSDQTIALGSESSAQTLAAASYSYSATYNGDTNNNAVTSACEPFSVGKASTSIATTVKDSTGVAVVSPVALGTEVKDTSIVSGAVTGFDITGTVNYGFWTSIDCGVAAHDSPTNEILAVGTDSALKTALGYGSYSYAATYSGNANYLASASACEPFTVGMAAPTISTVVLPSTSVDLGVAVHDTASFSGLVSGLPVTGTVTYSFFSDGACTLPAASTEDVTISTGSVVPASADKTGLVAGSYSYKASYGGDGNYGVAVSDCEPFSVSTTSSTSSTTSSTTESTFSIPTTSTTTTSETTSSTTSSTSTITTSTTESTFSQPTTITSQTDPHVPVGGQVYPVSKADLLDPYFALAAFLVVLAVVLGKRRRS